MVEGSSFSKDKSRGTNKGTRWNKKKREWEEDDDGWRGGRAGSFDNFFTLAQVGGVQLQWHQTKFISASIFIYLSLFFLVGVIWSSAVSYRSVKAGGTLAFHVYLWPSIDICPEWSDPDLASPTLYSNTHRRHVCPWEQNDVYNTLIVQMCLMPTWFQRREKESDREREKT